MNFEIKDKKGIKLKTANKFCTEDINVSINQNLFPAINTTEETINLEGQYDGYSIKLDELKTELNSTSVPNNGNVEKVYFNTSLSVAQVANIIESANLDFIEYVDPRNVLYYYYWFLVTETGKGFVIQKHITNEGTKYAIFDISIYGSTNVGIGSGTDKYIFNSSYGYNNVYWTGWDPYQEVPYPYEINDTAQQTHTISYINNGNSFSVGHQNDKLSKLISTTPFETKGFIDMKSYVEDKKIPLKIKVENPGVVEVVKLPTSNIQEDTLYKVNEVSDMNVYIKTGIASPSTLEEAIESLGATPNLTYYLVNALPDNPNISDLATFSIEHVYICNDIAYLYGDVGYGNMWLGVKDLVSSTTQIAHEDKGYVSEAYEIEEQGIYVSYKLGSYGVLNNKYNIKEYNNNNWVNKSYLYDKIASGEYFDIYDINIKCLANFSFHELYLLKNINLPNCEISGDYVLKSCTNLLSVNLPKIRRLGHQFLNGCWELDSVYIGNAEEIDTYCFNGCYSLKAIIITQDTSVCVLGNYSLTDYCYHFNGTENPTYNPNGDKDGYIYVPDSLVESYKVAENWSTHATQIKPLSELPQEYKELYGI